MPICRKCNKQFPLTAVIDGKRRNLSNRKFCIECSPFGQHNTRIIITDEVPYTKCNTCGREYVYVRGHGHSIGKCNTCWTNEKRRTLKDKALNYLGNKCCVCGYERSKTALEFHHVDPSKKEFSITSNNYKSWEIVKKELDKCILVCANCHREIHEGLISEVVITSDSKSESTSSNLV